MQLREALNDIAEIRAQIERTETFRGLRSLAVSASSLLVFCGAIASHYLQDQQNSVVVFVGIWATVAILGLVGAVAEMWFRANRSTSQTARRFVWQAHRAMSIQLAPSLLVGAVLTGVFVARPEISWVLPGMWAMVYSLGLISCRQHLPQAALWAASYFLVAGAACLIWAIDLTELNSRLAVWQMVVVFGIGQLLLAFLIYWKLERFDGETEN